jgi:polysaccharide biosynthesis transport protein
MLSLKKTTSLDVIDTNVSRELPFARLPESMRVEVRRLLFMLNANRPWSSMAVTSASPRAGVSSVCCMIAIALAEAGTDVALFDASNSHLGRTPWFDPDPEKARRMVGRPELTVWTASSRIRVVTQTLEPTIASHALHEQAVQQIAQPGATVLIDCPSMERSPEAFAFASATDGVLLVIESGRDRRDTVQESVRSLKAAKIPLLGVLINKRRD